MLNHAAKKYVLYIDGKYVHSSGAFQDGVTAKLDYLTFEVTGADSSFYIDDIYGQNADIAIVSQITQFDNVSLLTEVGKKPVLPDTVTARYNTGQAEEKTVIWDPITPSDYAGAGTFTVSGTIDGITIPARAVITVVKELKEISPVNVSTLAGVAPRLPSEVEVTYIDNTSEMKKVTWETINSSQYQEAGSFTVEGTVENVIGTAVASVTVIAKSVIPVITVDAYTDGGITSADMASKYLYAPDSYDISQIIEFVTGMTDEMIGNGIGKKMVNSFVEKNPLITAGAWPYDALRVLTTRDDNGDLYLMVLNRDTNNDKTATINLEGYTITGEAQISTLIGNDYVSCGASNHPNDSHITETTSSLGIGDSTFAYTFPACSVISIKLSGTVAGTDPWRENFQVRHLGSQNVGAIPPWLLVESGTADVQIDPAPLSKPGVADNNKAFMLKRTGTDTSVKATLSGQNFSASPHTTYDGLLKITFGVKAAQDDSASRFNVQVKGGNTTVLNLDLEGGKASCNAVEQFSYVKDRWYEIEFILDHRAGEYALYVDGKCVSNRNKYNNNTANPLDYLFFSAENADGAFYIDNLHIKQVDINIDSRITRVDDTYVTIPSGTAPVLPGTVNAVYNTGEKVSRTVMWESISPEKYAKRGTFTVTGAVDGLSLPAKAVVTVESGINAISPVTVSTTAGTVPVLPGKITAEYSDGTTEEKPVTWDEIDPAKYAAAGSFTVNGTVAGTTIKATATITVTPVTITGIQPVTVSTTAGTAPVLPGKITAEYSNGTTGEKSVIWDEIDPAKYAAAGSFTVSGTVAGTTIKATGTITVNDRFHPGDVNGDGDVNINDMIRVRDIVTGKYSTANDPAQRLRADVNGDDDVNINDMIRVRDIITGKYVADNHPR